MSAPLERGKAVLDHYWNSVFFERDTFSTESSLVRNLLNWIMGLMSSEEQDCLAKYDVEKMRAHVRK